MGTETPSGTTLRLSKVPKLKAGSTVHQNELALQEELSQKDHNELLTHIQWTKAVCIFGKSVLPGSVEWSLNNMVAVMVEDSVQIVDVGAALERVKDPAVTAVVHLSKLVPRTAPKLKDACISSIHNAIISNRSANFVALAWSPVGCGPDGSPLLAVAESEGIVGVFSLPVNMTASGRDSKLVWNLTENLKMTCSEGEMPFAHVIDSSGKYKVGVLSECRRYSCEPFSSSIRLAFCPSAITSPSDGTLSTLLCTAQGDMVCVWRLDFRSQRCECLVVLLVDKDTDGKQCCKQCVTGLAVSSLCIRDRIPDTFTVVVGLSTGAVQVWPLKLPKNIDLMSTGSIVVGRCQEVFCLSGRPVTDLALGANILRNSLVATASEDTYVIAVAHGLHVSAMILKPSTQESIIPRWVPKVYQRGPAAHRLPIISILVNVSGALASDDAHSFEHSIRIMTLDSSGHAAFWQLTDSPRCEVSMCESRDISPSDSREWLSPVGQVAVGPDARVIRGAAPGSENKNSSVIYSGITMSPSGSMFAMQAMGKSVRTTQSRPMTYLFLSPASSPNRVFISLLWAICNAFWKYRHGEVFTLPLWDISEAWYMSDVRYKKSIPRESLTTPTDVIACLWNMLNDSGPLGGYRFPFGALQTFLEQHLNIGLGHIEDHFPMHRCQLQNSCLELLARLISEKEFSRSVLKSSTRLSDQTLFATSLRSNRLHDFWTRRFHSGWPVEKSEPALHLKSTEGVLRHASVLSSGAGSAPFLAHDDLLMAPCRFCGRIAKPDKSLRAMSCGRHKLPLCQWSLVPLLFEKHHLCSMCGRTTDCFQRHRDQGSKVPSKVELPAEGICAWCAACVSVIIS